jgi:hypothetical protein
LYSSPPTPFATSPATSITPSDSVSQHHLASDTAIRSATRPPTYPEEILWHLEDCRSDPLVNIKRSNWSWPPINRCIRHPDGSLATEAEWRNIKTSGQLICHGLRQLPRPRDSRLKSQGNNIVKSKTYFRTYHAAAWTEAIQKLERMQPLVALCAPNWKAEHVLNNTLLAAHDPIDSHSSDDTPQTDHTPQSDHAPSSSRSSKKKEKDKRKKMKKKADNAMIPPGVPFFMYIPTPNASPRLPADYLGEIDNTPVPPSQSSKVGGSGSKRLEPSATSHEQPAKKKRRSEKTGSVVSSQCDDQDPDRWTSINFSNSSMPSCSGSVGFIIIDTSFVSLKRLHLSINILYQ